MKKILVLILIMYTEVLCTSVFASTPIKLGNDVNEVWINKTKATILEDTTNKWTVDDIISKKFNPITVNDPLNLNTHHYYWIKFLILDKRTLDKPMLIEIFDFNLDDIVFYQQDANGIFQEFQAGFEHPFYKRNLYHKNVTFHLYPIYQDSAYCYMRFKSKRRNVLKPVIKSYTNAMNYSIREYVFLSLFYGLMLLMIIFNFIHFVTLKSRNSLYFVFYAGMELLFFMSENGTGFQFLWPNSPYINLFVGKVSLILLELFLLLFTRHFLEIHLNHPRLNRFINWLLISRIILAIPQILFQLNNEAFILDLLYVQVVLLCAIRVKLKGFPSANWFIFAFCVFDVSCIIVYLEQTGVLSSNIFTVYAMYGGVIIQFTFLSIAIAKHVQKEFAKKKAIQAELIQQYEINKQLSLKVTQELEDKVNERTKELLQAQEELRAQSDKINKINLMLDLDNRKLKKDISHVVEASTKRGRFTFEEFKKAFPDDITCKRFIYKMKSQEGFTCKKCGGQNEINGKNQFDRRCSTCNYNESITANTIFHRTKFDLYKGFYMVYYLMYAEKAKLTNQHLAKELELNANSIQLFKRKVDSIIEDQRLKNKNVDLSWERVIMYRLDEKSNRKTVKQIK